MGNTFLTDEAHAVKARDACQLLRSHGIKVTRHRTLVLKLFWQEGRLLYYHEITRHFDKQIDRTTVYRTLKLFVKAGYILSDGSENSQFQETHVVFRCMQCQMSCVLATSLAPAIYLPPGYDCYRQQYVLNGHCPKCSIGT
jgi:Fur family transcriptional regulator, ferric uptake regulator